LISVRSRTPGERLIGLEALRFISALAILVFHYQHYLFVFTEPQGLVPDQQPFYGLLAVFYDYGSSAVALFWCISGFIFAWKYGSIVRRRLLSLRDFVYLRFSRLYPLHLVTLLLAAILNWLYGARHGYLFVYPYNDLRDFLLNLGFASGWGFERGYSFNGPVWSVSAEILVYLLFFLTCRRFGSNPRVDLAAVIAVSIIGMLARQVFGFRSDVFGAATFFYLGCVARHLSAMTERIESRERRVALCAALAMAMAVLAWLVRARMLHIAGASLALFPIMLLFCQMATRPVAGLAKTVLSTLGNLTYASYMLALSAAASRRPAARLLACAD